MLQQNMLQMISEENISSSSQQIGGLEVHSPFSLPNSPLAFLGLTFTPPQSFQTSPISSPSQNDNSHSHPQVLEPSEIIHTKVSQIAPSISVTDESGCLAQFPIIPPPLDFAHEFSNDFSNNFQLLEESNLQLNEEKFNSNQELQSRGSFAKLHRWKDGNPLTHH